MLAQVVAMQRKDEKGLFAVLDAKLKAEQVHFKVGPVGCVLGGCDCQSRAAAF